MIDQELKETINQKIQGGEFEVTDIPGYFTLFAQIGNETEDGQDEIEDWNRRIHFVMAGLGTYWISVENGRFSTGKGTLEDPNLVLTLDAAQAALIFAGKKDAVAAFMSGALTVQGDLPDALKLQTLIEIVAEEIEY
jgi:putative sterol carrier protein